MTKVRPIFLSLFLVAAIVVVNGCAAPSPAPSPTPPPKQWTFKIAEVAPAQSSRGCALLWFAQEVENRTDGQVKFEIYWGAALGSTSEMVPLVSAGAVDMAICFAGYFPAQFPLETVGLVMYNTETPYGAIKATHELQTTYEPLLKEQRQNNIRYLIPYVTARGGFLSHVLIRRVEDVKGLRIRATGETASMVRQWGGVPISLPAKEIYEAFDKGVVDAGVDFFHNIKPYRYSEVIEYVILAGFGPMALSYFGFNFDSWNQLPVDLQETLDKVADDYTTVYAYATAKGEEADLRFAEQEGVEIIEMAPEEKRRFREIGFQPVVDKWIAEKEAEGLPAGEMWQKYESLTQKYEKMWPDYPKGAAPGWDKVKGTAEPFMEMLLK